jgi:ABC-type polysaccharide/polyol phosphate export permease
MANHKITKEQKKNIKKNLERPNEIEFSPQVEHTYKIALRIMSWTVGSAIFLVIILFYFNSPVIDIISQVIFYIGIITLIIFLIIELIGDNVKNMLSKIIDKNTDGKSITN